MLIKRGVFTNVNEAISKLHEAFNSFSTLSYFDRGDLITEIRQRLSLHVDELAKMVLEETKMGNLQDKKEKIRVAIERTPGIEDIKAEVMPSDFGITVHEYEPYGLACVVLPSTNPCATFVNNVISLLAAGNVVAVCPHPRAANVTKYLVYLLNDIIDNKVGIKNVIGIMENNFINTTSELMRHPDISLIIATGGSDMARNALSCQKRVFSAGPGNPTFIVDETANIKRAAKDIVRGASFDNNILCIGEKNIIIVEDVLSEFKKELQKLDVYYIDTMPEMLLMSKALLDEEMAPNKYVGGKSANELLKMAGIDVDREYKLIAVETCKIHPFVTEEILVPMIAVVKVADFEEALEVAKFAEQGHHHTAGIHSMMIERLSIASREMNTSIFVKNGCSLNAIGIGNRGATGFSISNETGEGLVSARLLVRRKYCFLIDSFTLK